MEKTYNMLATIIVPGTENMTLENIAEEYRGTKSPSLLALAFKKLYKLILCTSNTYIGLTSADVASYALEKLDLCLLTYEPGNYKFTTYFTTVLKNKFREETENLNTHKRKAIFHTDSYEAMVETGFDIADDTAFTVLESEVIEDLKSYNLSERELLYCEYLVQEIPNKEIAELIGVSQMTLSNMRKRLKEKLMPLALNIA